MDSASTNQSLGDDGPASGLSIKALFGPLFTISKESKLCDPSLLDTHKFLSTLFGLHVSESDIHSDPQISEVFKVNAEAVKIAELESLFGTFGARSLPEQPLKSLATLNSTYPSASNLPKSDDVWLVEMPKIHPNRQTLHADPQPIKKNCPYHPSTPRMLFTPSNVMRWGYYGAKNAFVSNARVIRWSDGSLTLHVGNDVYSLNDRRGTAEFHVLGTKTVVSKNGGSLPAITASNLVRRHVVMDSAEAISVQQAVAEETGSNLVENREEKLGYTSSILPPINWESVSKTKNIYEEFVFMEYEKRKKIIARRLKEGRPMSLVEQFQMEQELFDTILAAKEGRMDLEAHKAQTRNETRKQSVATRHRPRKFQRNTELEGGNPIDPFEDASNESESEGYEEMMENMKRKRDQEDMEEHMVKRSKHESEVSAELVKELEGLITELPRDSDVYTSVDGTIEMLKSSMSFHIVEKEVMAIIEAVQKDFPLVDISGLIEASEKFRD